MARNQGRFGTVFLVAILFVVGCSSKKVTEEGMPTGADASAATAGAGAAALEGTSDLKTVYFAFDESALSSDARAALKANAAWLKSHPSANVQIEGHCDERGSVEYNLALGERRANAVSSYLKRLGVDASRLSVISYGNQRPADSGHDETAWAHNRRAVPMMVATSVSRSN